MARGPDKTKTAGGQIAGRLTEFGSMPFVGPARARNVNRSVQRFFTNRVSGPIERGLKKARVHKAFGKAVEVGMTPIPKTPKLVLPVLDKAQRKDFGARAGEKFVKTVAENPETALIPRPDHSKLYLAGKQVMRRVLGAEDLLHGEGMAKGAGDLTRVLMNPTVRKALAATATAIYLKHLFDKSQDEYNEGFRTGPPMEQPYSYPVGLAKKAEVETHDHIDDVRKVLQPGVMLYTKPRKIDGLKLKAFYALNSAVQRSPYTHVGMYVGDDKVVDAALWKSPRTGSGSTKVHLLPLSRVVDRYDFKVLRVDASRAQRARAVDYAKDQVGKDFNTHGMIRSVLPFREKATSKNRSQAEGKEEFFCSELVANAYADVNIASKKALEHVVPRDIERSKKVKTVAHFEKAASLDGARVHQQRSRRAATGVRPLSKTAAVSPYQQRTQHTCSAACLKAVLGHYGFEADEHDLAGFIGVRQKGGAETTQIADAARRLGLDCFEYSFDSLEQAKWLLDQDIPIIADIQSFNHPGSGHYVVITAIDDQGVHLMDPNTPGNERVIPHEEMEQRWWDRAMKPPHDLMPKWGVIVLPPENV